MTLGEKLRKWSTQEGLSAGWLTFFFVVAMGAIMSREPSLFTHPQLVAEDGTAWYGQAYNLGWIHALTLPFGGYLQTLQRLAAGPALMFPLRWAPLPMLAVGLMFQALPVPILLSSRCSDWASLPVRLAFAATYVAIPNADEIHVILTNSQWHLAMVLAILAFAAAPSGWPSRLFEGGLFLVGSFTGPFGLLLMPLICVFWWFRRQRWSLLILGILAGGTLVQLIAIVRHPVQRFLEPIGATPVRFVQLVGGNAFVGALLGSQHAYGITLALAWSLLALLLGATLIFYCFRHVSLSVRLFFVYCGIQLAAGLRTPAFLPTNQQLWPVLLPQTSLRYWFFPSLALLFAVVWCLALAHARVVRGVALCFAVLLCLGVWKSWKIRPMSDVGFRQGVSSFEAAKPGEHVSIPINPPGWTMTLIKR